MILSPILSALSVVRVNAVSARKAGESREKMVLSNFSAEFGDETFKFQIWHHFPRNTDQNYRAQSSVHHVVGEAGRHMFLLQRLKVLSENTRLGHRSNPTQHAYVRPA